MPGQPEKQSKTGERNVNQPEGRPNEAALSDMAAVPLE